jgi:hypothetical protein
MRTRPLVTLLALAAASSPDLAQDVLGRFKTGLREGVARDPMDAALGAVLIGSYLFYLAERGHNPKVTSYYDALVYVSTNLSVGYCDIFARTSAGKAIGSALMTYGPAMAAGIFGPPAKERPAMSEETRAVVDRLDAILAALSQK